MTSGLELLTNGVYVIEPHSLESRTVIANLDGVFWGDAPLPRRWHACWAQTRGWDRADDGLMVIFRCACGAIRALGDPRWSDKNSRRKGRHLR